MKLLRFTFFIWCFVGLVPFALWVFGALPIPAPAITFSNLESSASEKQAMLGRWLFCILLCASTAIVWLWVDAFRFGGSRVARTYFQFIRLQLNSRSYCITLLGCIIFAGITIWMATQDELLNPYILHIHWLTIINAQAIVLRPPIAIALMPSSKDSADFLSCSAHALFPLRLITLVDAGRVGPVMMFEDDSNLRVLGKVDWEPIVHKLIDLMPLIVIDYRFESVAVNREFSYVMSSDSRMNRTVVVTTDYSKAPNELKVVGGPASAKSSMLLHAGLNCLSDAIWSKLDQTSKGN